MLNFNYSIPTKIFFGKSQISVLGEQIKKYGSRVLLTYGGGSIKKNGIYDKVIKILESNNIEFVELSGIDPNPRVTSVREGVKLCKENNIDFILAVGGGSTIDCSKVIAASYYYEGDPWDIVIKKVKINKALPIGSILTLAATGSEMDAGAVISNIDTNEKIGVGHPFMAPKFSILDPEYTFTVPKNQTAAGTADIMSHIFEAYFSKTKEAYIQNRMAEAILKTCIKYGKVAIKEPENYEARANLMWASSLAINGLLSYGKSEPWSVHPMEHELSAFYDITHGVGLAILTPNWMKYVLGDENVNDFYEYGVNVWDINPEESKYEVAQKAIEKTREYFIELGIPATLKEVGIGEEKLEQMAEAATRNGTLGEFRPLSTEDVLNIYKLSL
ncbi:iron-containing alcohol dehydrogenase [Clostridium botulinum]|uniref:Iron-containing alcohol dehydrogenase n=2 Tax=Clostridium botulinum TaxID=1491 RepID=A0A846ICP3_CLOBO|nr:iron-containing alcohol dehydrogenase [Clostridium botulinum]AJD28555.1 NADH-dependent butanol dehydrogenase A [Clostridium botulinum CDC_297]ACQ52090.1 NADH-dependent butanol dehydrogenase [Clostridium botulinum Ba4 str. 657]AJE09314.1 NADH-dependent butanol dehydrogenase A [Clostridium botulinum CDC_1436]APR01066.1 NADH-dependent butanol dehydrogenase A [Clostridium botulinum]AUN02995.1 NADH-dependent alcohol dehydrogenase [Clostridium botulinum]